ncbi:hypothetical protein PSPO01_08502 [Paraphaeosphaeria sporulosa]
MTGKKLALTLPSSPILSITLLFSTTSLPSPNTTSPFNHLRHNIIQKNAPTATRQLNSPIKVFPLVVEVRIDEDEIELAAFFGQLMEHVERRMNAA